MPASDTDLFKTAFRKLKARLGEAWRAQLTPADRAQLERLLADAAAVTILSLTDRSPKVAQAKKEVDASLAHVASIQAGRAQRELWAAVGEAVKDLLAGVVKVVL